jgi:hypothetical protein
MERRPSSRRSSRITVGVTLTVIVGVTVSDAALGADDQ